MTQIFKNHPILKIVNNSLRDLPSPSAIHSFWNFGSLLGFCLLIQLLTGLFLAMHYTGDSNISFYSINHMSRDVNFGWLLRMIHANGASAFFICIYLHLARGMFFGSFKLNETWSVGVIILLLVMGAAFMGYVLPWGQMSFWGATVITNLLSAIPYVGPNIVVWLWGGFAVDNATLTRFFTFHFLIPFIVTAAVAIHLLFLHQSGSSNPLGLEMNSDKSPFHPYFSVKDFFGGLLFFLMLIILVGQAPWVLGDPENFIPANPLVTPVHIQPEWYFLFAYAILRSIPNKLGGVLALAMAVMIFLILPFWPQSKMQSLKLYPANKFMFWVFISLAFLLTWIGARPVEEPYVVTGQALTLFYFIYFFTAPIFTQIWDSISGHSLNH